MRRDFVTCGKNLIPKFSIFFPEKGQLSSLKVVVRIKYFSEIT